MRIGFGGIAHETNSFCNISTTEEMFRRCSFHAGKDLVDTFRSTRTFIGGVVDESIQRGAELAPALYANTTPSGIITAKTLDSLLDQLLDGLKAQHAQAPLDAIALCLHGAGACESCFDIEGRIIRAVREVFGPDMLIGVSLDLHGNITEEMLSNADVLIGVRCYPHVDEYETAREVVALLWDCFHSKTRPAKKLIKLPWLLAAAYGVTLSGAAHKVQQKALALEQENEDLLRATFFHGFPYADIPQASVSIVALARTQEAADSCATQIARFAWSIRQEFPVPALSPAQVMDLAMQEEKWPVVINESSDNPGGGAPGDGTHLLREMLKRNIPGSAFGYMYDPAVVKQAVAAGVGSTISCSLGAKMDNLHGQPILIENAYVKCISDGNYICLSPMGAGSKATLGVSVCLQVGNVLVVVGSERRQTMDKNPFLIVGIDVYDMKILGLKSSQHFKGWWKDHAAKIITCDPPGIHCGDLSVFDFKHADTSFFPLSDARWDG